MAKITIEVEVEVTGTYTPGYPASRDDPGSDGEVNDLEVVGMVILSSDSGYAVDPETGKMRYFSGRERRVDLLAYLDDLGRDKVASQVLSAIRDEAEDAVREEAAS